MIDDARLSREIPGGMTRDRLQLIIEHCFRQRRKASLTAYYIDIARFIDVDPHTLKRYLSGARPIPRQTEIIFEILYHWPEITAARIDGAIAKRDRASPKRDSDAQ